MKQHRPYGRLSVLAYRFADSYASVGTDHASGRYWSQKTEATA
jgi:hypothetical protein